MTPSEKLIYVSKITYGSENIEELNKKCRSLINERQDELTSVIASKKSIENILNEMKIEKPSTEFNEENIPDKIKLETQKLRDLENKLSVYKNEKKTRDKLIIELNRLPDDETTVSSLRDVISQNVKYEQYLKEKTKLDAIKFTDIEPDELIAMINDTKKMMDLELKIVDISKVRNELRDINEIKNKFAVKLNCPACHSDLALWNEELSVNNNHEAISFEKSKNYEKDRVKLQQRLNVMIDVETELNLLKEQYPNVNVESQLKRLNKIQKNNEDFKTLSDKCAALKCDKPCDNVEIVSQKVESKMKRVVLERQLRDFRLEDVDCDLISSKIESSRDKLMRLNETKLLLHHRDQWNKFSVICEEEKEIQKKLDTAVRLYSLIKIAERMAIQRNIDRINFEAQIYLDKFFNDITVELIFDGKIIVNVTHNDHESDLSALSGGELARIILAYTISIAKINNVQLLLLDESLASLDQESTNLVMNCIKENFNGRVISISHQMMKGTFDQVIEL